MEAIVAPPIGADADADEVELLALSAHDDPAAFAELYLRHREVVFRYRRARCASDDLALELAAVTFERAFRSVGRYDTRGGGFMAWLFRIARNAAVDHARRERARRTPTWAMPSVRHPSRWKNPASPPVRAEGGEHCAGL